MADLFDYMDWRGDLSFWNSPANEADYYIISKIGCPDLTDCVPSDEREVFLPEAVETYQFHDSDDAFTHSATTSKLVVKSFFRLPSVPRFQQLRLSGFRNIDDRDKTEQFSALMVGIPDGTHFITFRGTDDNIFAWKENFQLSVMDTIPAQEDALRYLQWAMEVYEGKFIICGHSKGGNLAIYASSMLPESMQDRIISVYSFDGPGFQDDFIEGKGCQRILPKLHSLISQNSMIGLLLSTGKNPEIVMSNCSGARAHDGFTWQVLGNHFVRSETLSENSQLFKKAMTETLSEMSREERSVFIDDFFQIISSTGAATITDLTEIKILRALELTRSLNRDKEIHKFTNLLISNSIADFRNKKETDA